MSNNPGQGGYFLHRWQSYWWFLPFPLAIITYLLLCIIPKIRGWILPAENYLSLHILLEGSSIFMAMAGAGIVWYADPRKLDYHALSFASALFLGGLIDTFHTLSYAGMPPFLTPSSALKATTFWMAARLFTSLGLLLSSFVYRCRPRCHWPRQILPAMVLGLAGAILVVVTYFPGMLPPMYIPGQGLTPLKINLEYLVVFILLLASLPYWRRALQGYPEEQAIINGQFMAMLSSLVFTRYQSVYDATNLLGHIYKIFAYAYFYRATFILSIQQPYRQLELTRAQLAAAYDNLEQLVKERTRQLQEAATTDFLTGVYNRRQIETFFKDAFSEARRQDKPLSILLLDLDDFKIINDTLGHQEGDRCLKRVAKTARDLAGNEAAVGRFGGDEFLIVLPGRDAGAARNWADNLRRQVQGGEIPLTISIGIATYNHGWPASTEEMLRLADRALYGAKARGKNSIMLGKRETPIWCSYSKPPLNRRN
ncbi:sensor domain-containing diguanylate cyclase [Moorella sp. Hama-1]|nr:GGDEF domain-containing protein [Moorella sp. Hama-1]